MTSSRRVLSAAALMSSAALLAGCGAISSLAGDDPTADPSTAAPSDTNSPQQIPTESPSATDATVAETTSASPGGDSASSQDIMLNADELGIGNELKEERQTAERLGADGEFTMSYSVDGVDLPKNCADAIQAMNDASSQANRLAIVSYTGDFGDAVVDNPTGDSPSVLLYHVTTDQEGSIFAPVGEVQQNCSTASGQNGQVTMTTVPVGSYPNSFNTTLEVGPQTITFAGVGQDFGTEHVYLLAMNLTPEAVQTVADNQKAKAESALG